MQSNTNERILLVDSEKVKKNLTIILLHEWQESQANKREFDFNTLYIQLSVTCEAMGISLRDIRIDIGSEPLLKDLTLLHLMVKVCNVVAVDILTREIEKKSHSIPCNVGHPTQNTLLHYCGLWAQNDLRHISQTNVGMPLNWKMLQIVDLLSDPKKPSHLNLTKDELILNQLGETPLHFVARAGAIDMFHFCCQKEPSISTIPRLDGKKPLDLINPTDNKYIHFRSLAAVVLQLVSKPTTDSSQKAILSTLNNNVLPLNQQHSASHSLQINNNSFTNHLSQYTNRNNCILINNMFFNNNYPINNQNNNSNNNNNNTNVETVNIALPNTMHTGAFSAFKVPTPKRTVTKASINSEKTNIADTGELKSNKKVKS